MSVTAGTVQPVTLNMQGDNAILQGSTYYREFAVTLNGSPFDLTQWTGGSKGARCQLRQTKDNPTVIATPTVAIKSPASAGVITISMSSTVTAGISVTSGFFDIELFDGTVSPELVDRPVEGEWALVTEVTRP